MHEEAARQLTWAARSRIPGERIFGLPSDPNAVAKDVAAGVLRALAEYMGPRVNTIGVADIRHIASEIEST